MIKRRGLPVRDKILSTAGKLFYQQGYHLTGINQVISESDIAKASLYKHFNSKTDLLQAYVRNFDEGWFAGFGNFILTITDPKQRLLALFDYRITRQQSVGHRGCALIKVNNEIGATEPDVQKLISQHKKQLKDLVWDLVRASGHRQLLSDEELAETVYLMSEGGIVSASIFKSTEDLEAARRIIQKLL